MVLSPCRRCDVGVAHWRAPAYLEWLDWLVGRPGGESLLRILHIELIVQAALGCESKGQPNSKYSKCWHRWTAKRVTSKAGVSGMQILRSKP